MMNSRYSVFATAKDQRNAFRQGPHERKIDMRVSKIVGVILLADFVCTLLSLSIHAKNSMQSTASQAATISFPKDIYPDSRNRLPLPKRDDMDDHGKKVFDELTQTPLLPGDPVYPVRLYSPKFAEAEGEAHHYLKYETGLSGRLMEIAILVTARQMGCQYEWTQYERFGRNLSDPRHIEQSTIDIIKYNKPVSGLGEKEAAIITLGRETFGQRKVSSKTFAEVVRLFGRKGTVDLVELMAQYSAVAAEITVFNQQLKPGQEPLLPAR
jgi:4-carboxymuconolactone decarboxylase